MLREAGADDADMLVAVTSSDETNMVACQVAYSLFNTPNRIARIRSPDYVRDADKLFHSEAVPIDHLIAPEQLVIDNIYRLIEYPRAAGGELRRRESKPGRCEGLLWRPAGR